MAGHQYGVLISEPVEGDLAVEPGEPTPEVRDVWWEGEAAAPEAAKEKAMQAGPQAWHNNLPVGSASCLG